MFIMQVIASQLIFLPKRNAKLAVQSTITLASHLLKNRGTCFIGEWPSLYCAGCIKLIKISSWWVQVPLGAGNFSELVVVI